MSTSPEPHAVPSVVPRAPRDGSFNTRAALSVVGRSSELSPPTSAEVGDYSLFLEQPSALFEFAEPTQLDDLIQGPRTTMPLYLSPNSSRFIDEALALSVREKPKLTKGRLITLALAHSLLHTLEWRGRAPIDGRQSTSEIAVSKIARRTTVKCPQEIVVAFHTLYYYMRYKHDVYPSLESLKMTGLDWGLNQYERWRTTISEEAPSE